MLATKFCDVCDTELPPMAFQSTYECCDVSLHENHPDKSYSHVRITASPRFTNGDPARRVDICPDCFLRLCEALVMRMNKRNKREASKLDAWKEWRQASRNNEIERAGCNEQRKVPYRKLPEPTAKQAQCSHEK